MQDLKSLSTKKFEIYDIRIATLYILEVMEVFLQEEKSEVCNVFALDDDTGKKKLRLKKDKSKFIPKSVLSMRKKLVEYQSIDCKRLQYLTEFFKKGTEENNSRARLIKQDTQEILSLVPNTKSK